MFPCQFWDSFQSVYVKYRLKLLQLVSLLCENRVD